MTKNIQPYSERQEKFGSWLIRNIGKWQVAVYRATGGRVWNRFLGAPVAILTSTGHKSGEIRRTPLLFLEQGETVVIAASKGGMSKPPVWMLNLQKKPACEIQIGAVNRPMCARIASTEEEKILWPKLTAIYADFSEYRARTEGVRHIPLFVLEPR
ncbi:MAG: nitroreductase family deazaflavin-dependent oxidoreductase [Cellvibrionales bacterium]|nr:nitroreductase family deazaflavin-dependent oxidoreductase [Cellvibrionales bacterium]